jgi:hypothetical protein
MLEWRQGDREMNDSTIDSISEINPREVYLDGKYIGTANQIIANRTGSYYGEDGEYLQDNGEYIPTNGQGVTIK